MIITINNQGTFTTDAQQATKDTSASYPTIAVRMDLAAQAANLATKNIYLVPMNAPGMYRVWGHVIITQAATTSATMPDIVLAWTDADTKLSTNQPVTTTSAVDAVGTAASGGLCIYPKVGTPLQVSTAGYLSTGATAMQYSLHIRVEYVG